MTTLATILGGGGDVPLWYSGMTVQKWWTVRSPADGELYTRTAATGAGATDPADDVTNYVAFSFRRAAAVTSFVPRIVSARNSSAYAVGGTRASPVINAGVRTLLFSGTGRGNIAFLGFYKDAGTARNVRVEMIVDGRTIFDNTIAYPATAGLACTCLGLAMSSADGYADQYAYPDGSPIEFRRSCAVYVTPSAATTASDVFVYLLRAQA